MKRYMLFAASNYYPEGGWDDFVAAFDSVEEARTHLQDKIDLSNDGYYHPDFWHIVDGEEEVKVLFGRVNDDGVVQDYNLDGVYD